MLISSGRKSGQGTPSNWGGNHYLSCQARCRLDARLWLTCRLALAKGLLEEDSGMGKLGGSARSVTAAIGSCLHHCQQGLDEAEAFGDIELMAEFLFLSVVQTLQQGKISDEMLEKLEVNCFFFFFLKTFSVMHIVVLGACASASVSDSASVSVSVSDSDCLCL